ncbi:MAG: Crp/Fnr family transcriptional regulator [Rhodospirillales bacterium]|nr:Crp/Fnr family transcriptional regulator [Rhodospirillales bacterium]
MLKSRELIQESDIFSKMPLSVVDEIWSSSRIRNFSKTTIIYSKGDDVDGLYGILEGAVRFSSSDPDGREVMLGIMQSGQWFGEISMIDGGPRPTNAIARPGTTVIYLARSDFWRILKANPDLYQPVVQFLCEHIRFTFSFANDAAFLGVKERLAKQLFVFVDHYARAEETKVEIDQKLTQEELGRMIGASRESVSQHMNEWRRDKILTFKYGRITVLDTKKLRKIINVAQGYEEHKGFSE